MKTVKNAVIVNLRGEAVQVVPSAPNAKATPLTIATAVQELALSPAWPGRKAFTPKEVVERTKFATTLQNVQLGSAFKISPAMAKELQAHAAAIYPVVVASAVVQALS